MAFRDLKAKFSRQGTKLLGISKDSVASHEKFAAKYDLNFPLLADEDHAVADGLHDRVANRRGLGDLPEHEISPEQRCVEGAPGRDCVVAVFTEAQHIGKNGVAVPTPLLAVTVAV